MSKKKHKRKVSRIIIFTTDAVDAGTRQIRFSPFGWGFCTALICILIGAMIGVVVHEKQVWDLVQLGNRKQAEKVVSLEQEKIVLGNEIDALNGEIAGLNDKLVVLGTTLNEHVRMLDELKEEMAKEYLPTGYPLNGSASFSPVSEGEPMLVFTSASSAMVVASANGTVVSVEADETFGNKVTVDHGNGYISVYRSNGNVQVKAGDEIKGGHTLFLLISGNMKLGYQIMEEGVYIAPLTMLSING